MNANTAEVKRIAEAFRNIYQKFSDNCRRQPAIGIRNKFSFSSTQTYVITLGRDTNGERMQVDNADAFPPGTSDQMQKAINRHSQCTMTVIIYMSLLRDYLQALGAQVSWHSVLIKPRILQIYDSEGEEPRMPFHHVFCIKTTDGKEYIADFTIEQFGFFEHWFMEKDKYLAECTPNGFSLNLSEADMARIVNTMNEGRGAKVIKGFRDHFERHRARNGL